MQTERKETLDELLGQIVELDTIDDSFIGKTITIAGWVHTARWQKKLIFVKLSDSTESKMEPFQIIFQQSQDPMYFDELTKVARGAGLVIKGKIVASPASGQKLEMQGKQYYVTGHVTDPEHYPLAGSASTNIELLRSLSHLECHSQHKSAIYKIRSSLMKATELFFESKRYTKVDMPLITFSECEGGCQPMQATLLLTENSKSKIPTKTQITKSMDGLSTIVTETDIVDFSKDFFETKASLTVSAQLELETQLPLGNVWTVTRAIRGEPSQTTRHLCEFSMIEIEKKFSRSAKDIMDISEEFIKFSLKYVIENCPKQLAFLKDISHKTKLEKYISDPFVRITHAQAVEMMLQDVKDSKVTFQSLPAYDEDMGSEHERYLVDIKYSHPVIVMRYPKAVKAFYMPVLEETLEESHGVEHVDSFDILVPDVGELVGGSQRIYKLEELESRIDELRLDKEPLQFYIDLRKYGSCPHGGCGIGFERLVKFATGADSVKDCVPFPKYLGCGKKQH